MVSRSSLLSFSCPLASVCLSGQGTSCKLEARSGALNQMSSNRRCLSSDGSLEEGPEGILLNLSLEMDSNILHAILKSYQFIQQIFEYLPCVNHDGTGATRRKE